MTTEIMAFENYFIEDWPQGFRQGKENNGENMNCQHFKSEFQLLFVLAGYLCNSVYVFIIFVFIGLYSPLIKQNWPAFSPVLGCKDIWPLKKSCSDSSSAPTFVLDSHWKTCQGVCRSSSWTVCSCHSRWPGWVGRWGTWRCW